jgi:uncharacterized protein YjbJ (UPF0337 family)
MKWDEMAEKWKHVKGKVKKTWRKLTDYDLTAIAGEPDQLAAILKQKYCGELVPVLIPVTISDFSQGRS